MNRFLLAIGLIAALSTPALASLGKEPTSYGQRHVERISTHQRMWGQSERKLDSGEAADPYWTPCDYSTSWGMNSCD